MSFAQEFWQLIIAAAGGVSLLLLALSRIKGLKDGIATDATRIAIWRQKVEDRIAHLEEELDRLEKKDEATIELLNKIYSSLASIREDLLKEIQRVELKLAKVA